MYYILMSSTCSKRKYDEIYRARTRPILDSSQKFFLSLITGLSSISGVRVSAICELPVSHNCYPKLIVKKDKDKENNICYYYTGLINLPVLKTVSTYVQAKRTLERLIKDSKEDVIILCDALSLSMSLAALRCKKKSVKKVCIATDLPMMSVFQIKNRLKQKLYSIYNTLTQACVERFDAYIELVDKMDGVINPRKKPSMVLECILSVEQLNDERFVDDVNNSKANSTVMYAGKLHAEFGLELLANAINLVKHQCVLDIYGEGNFKDALKEMSKNNSRIRVHDAVTVDEVVRLEKNSTVLVNPRTSEGEFTKYSFPSKTVEYMMTGVPVAMFKLPGIPHEYSNYLNYANSEDAANLAEIIDTIFEDYSTAKTRAIAGRKFVMQEKNHVSQARKLHVFLNNALRGE